MTRATRRGFTLVELLVVILIIGMLVGLLVPAVISARARARRTQCLNNQKELALAIQGYENAQGELPGYINRFGSRPTPFSWPVVILQYLDRNDLWQRWRGGSITPVGTPPSDLEMMVCPADTEAGPGALSYVANCGIRDGTTSKRLEYDSTAQTWSLPGTPPTAADGPTHGVFLNRFVTPPPDPVRTEEIPDGARSTILISENLQGGYWNDVDERYVGIIWDGSRDNWDYTPSSCWAINSCNDRPSRPVPPRNDLARPSSNHPGGVIVTYCAGNSGFLAESVDYNVYISLMTPDNVTAKGPPDVLK